MTEWQVFLKGKLIDTVFYQDTCDEYYILDSLVNHDGYDFRIKVVRGNSEH